MIFSKYANPCHIDEAVAHVKRKGLNGEHEIRDAAFQVARGYIVQALTILEKPDLHDAIIMQKAQNIVQNLDK